MRALSLALLVLLSAPVEAQPNDADAARQLFQQGLALAGEERWAEALEAFRQSRALVERPSTVFNMASVLVRLGQVREALRALDDFMRISDPVTDATDRASVPTLRASFQAMLSELVLTVQPSGAAIEVDGVAIEGEGSPRTIALDPGRHHITVEAEGHRAEDLVVTGEAGARIIRTVALRPLGAALVIRSVESATLRVDGEEVGTGEATVELEPGEHEVEARADGYEPFQRTVTLAPGERFTLEAELTDRGGVATRWWFWTIIGAVVAGATITTLLTVDRTGQPYGGTAGFTLRP